MDQTDGTDYIDQIDEIISCLCTNVPLDSILFEGYLSLESIWSQLKNPREATYYIAGPPAMIQTLTGNLRKKNISPEMIKVDAWE